MPVIFIELKQSYHVYMLKDSSTYVCLFYLTFIVNMKDMMFS